MPPTDDINTHKHRTYRHHHPEQPPVIYEEHNPQASKASPSLHCSRVLAKPQIPCPTNQMQNLSRWDNRKARKRKEKYQEYGKPQRTFVPAKPTRPLHHVVQFFRRGATVVVHIINFTGRWVSSETLFDTMLPYEELGLIKYVFIYM